MTAQDQSARQVRAGRTPLPWLHRIAGAALVFAIVLPLSRRSINLSDEGYILLQALDMVRGKVLYRDMDAFVSPGIWFLLSGLFRVVEPSVLASRLLSLGAFAATAAVAFRIVDRAARRAIAWATVGALLVGVVWAFPIWTWTFYSPFAVLFGLCALDRLLIWRRRTETRDLVWLGVWLGLAVTFKQNYGAFASIGALAGYAAVRFSASDASGGAAKEIGAMALGGFAIGVPVLLYLVANGAVTDAFRSLVVHPFVFAGQHSVPYLQPGALFAADLLDGTDRFTYGASSLYRIAAPGEWIRDARVIERLHVLLYSMAPLVLLSGAALAVRGRRKLDLDLFCIFAVATMMFLGVFPRADYNHLMNVYQPVLVLGAVVLDRLARAIPAPRAGWFRAFSGAGCVLLAAYVSVAVYWYVQILTTMDAKITPKRGGVLERPEIAQRLNQLTEVIWANTRSGDALLSVPDLAMLNFLADREMPSPYYNLYQHHIAHDAGAAVVEGSRSRGVRLAITRYNGFFSDRERLRDYAPALIDHLDRDFAVQFTAAADNFVVLHARPRPAPRQQVVRLLEHCELEPTAGTVDHQIREHLLFSTLYQDEGAHLGEPEWIVESRCTIELPDDPRLTLSVRPGYYPPREAEPGATLEFEVRVEREGFPAKRVIQHREAVVMPPHLQLIRPWPRAQRADLAAYAGQTVTLVFRGHRRGRVDRNPHAFKGYSTMWIDPRLTHPLRQ